MTGRTNCRTLHYSFLAYMLYINLKTVSVGGGIKQSCGDGWNKTVMWFLKDSIDLVLMSCLKPLLISSFFLEHEQVY